MMEDLNKTTPTEEPQPVQPDSGLPEAGLPAPLQEETLPPAEDGDPASGTDMPEIADEVPAEEVETPLPEVEEPVYPEQPDGNVPFAASEERQEEAPSVPSGPEDGAGQGVPVSPPPYQAGPQYGQPGWYPPQQPPVQQGYPYPPYGQPQQQAPYYQQPVQQPYYAQPAQPYYNAPQPVYGYPYGVAAQPPKKKMSVGLKVFIWIASILAGLAILGFGGYLIYNVVNGGGMDVSDFNGNMPWLEDQMPDKGNQFPFTLPDDPDSEAPDDGDDTPDFDDGVTPPDTDDPLPDVDVTPNNEGITIEKTPAGDEMSAKEVYEKVVKSTVTVAVILERGGVEQDSTGTGIIATADGYIITNAHVVLNSKSSRVKITTYDGEEYDAVVVGMDRTTDLAVLKTNDHKFSPAEFGDADELVIGDSVIAIGNPGGAKFSGSMTGGYVSGLDRAVGKYSENGMTYLQTDAAINPGNSGGPLVNMYGQVVGINSSKIITDGYEGMGFAIPVSKAKPIIDQLLSGGYVKGRVRLGITGTDTANIGGGYAMSGGPQGFMITEINDDSVFVDKDAREGDVIVAIDGETVTCLDEISNLLLKYAPGDEVTVTLYRPGRTGGDEIEVTITLLEDKGETQQ